MYVIVIPLCINISLLFFMYYLIPSPDLQEINKQKNSYKIVNHSLENLKSAPYNLLMFAHFWIFGDYKHEFLIAQYLHIQVLLF